MKTTRFLAMFASALMAAACQGGDAGREDEEPEGPTAEADQALLDVDVDAIRLLEQGTFGLTKADLNSIVAHGGSAGGGINWWIDNQIAKPASHYTFFDPCPFATPTPAGPCMHDQFFDLALAAPDQLRQRVAFALMQIFVTSLDKVKRDSFMVPYANMMIDHAFGDLEHLLVGVAESPAMGIYLDNVNNFVVDKGLATVPPNENFARELMQLFTVGLCELNQTGTLVGGVCTPPYSQDDVENYAHLMSGWTFDNGTGQCPTAGTPRKVTSTPNLPMLACNSADHDYTQFPLLNRFDKAHVYKNGAGSPSGGWSTRDAMEKPLDPVGHTSGVIADLFHHPNIGPFLGKQLIQHLVTSNPSGAYVSRVAGVFADDGSAQHKRGNLAAVIKAILTDTEARNITPGSRYGHLREPVLHVTSVARLLGVKSGKGLRAWAREMGQQPFHAPSVFNFYPPNYQVPTSILPAGTTPILGPELAIEDTYAAITRANYVDALLYKPTTIQAGLALDLSALPATAAGMIDWCNAYLLHNKMTSAMAATLTSALTGVTGDALKKRAIYLVASSTAYQIER